MKKNNMLNIVKNVTTNRNDNQKNNLISFLLSKSNAEFGGFKTYSVCKSKSINRGGINWIYI